MKTETLEFNTANGASTAYVATPDESNGKAVIIIQEWWGLNDHIKDIANRYAAEGFTAIAPDLYRGKVTKDKEEAGRMMQNLDIEDGLNTIMMALDKARESYGFEKFGITGFCMGGTYALRAACELEGLSAAAPFYGDIPEEDVLKKLTVPTLFIAGKLDAWINEAKVNGLKEAATKHDLPVEVVSYDADHAFFNDTRPQVYDADAAKDAWQRVLQHFKKYTAADS